MPDFDPSRTLYGETKSEVAAKDWQRLMGQDCVPPDLDPAIAAEIARDVVSRESLLRRVQAIESEVYSMEAEAWTFLRTSIYESGKQYWKGYLAAVMDLRAALGGGKEAGGGRSS